MINNFQKVFSNKKVVILGFGVEGQSTFQYLKTIIPLNQIIIADKNISIRDDFNSDYFGNAKLVLGEDYLEKIKEADIFIKSPGIPKDLLSGYIPANKISSQTDLFLRFFGKQTIGITGTKGKSTTSSLIYHILKLGKIDAILVGNIGKPPFDYISEISSDTKIVYELSSHQLDDVKYSPHIAILLNLFEEHLDHYGTYNKYVSAKFNIFKFQKANDYFISGSDIEILNFDSLTSKLLLFSTEKHVNPGAYIENENFIRLNSKESEIFDFSSRKSLPGQHNLKNIMSAVLALKEINVSDEVIKKGVDSFSGLAHRLEYVTEKSGVKFYNDSIATIPEATIQALKTLKEVDTLILGGKDRGIDYQSLVDFLPVSGVINIIFMGEAGKRILRSLEKKGRFQGETFVINRFEEITDIIKTYTKPGRICLLSPSASSYDMFKNFAERGEAFKKIAENISFPAI